MVHQIYHLNSFDDTRLFVQLWQPQQKPKAVICLVHGIGEHCSRYSDWVERFVKEHYAVIGFDQRGHGLSAGKRGLISSYQDFMNDIDCILQEKDKLFGAIPSFLYGHSMGGGEVLSHFVSRNSNYNGVISTSPWLITQASPPKFIIPLVRLFNKIMPSFCLQTKFDSQMLSHDPEVVQKYNDDDLVHHQVSLRLFIDAYDAGYKLINDPQKLNKPLLLMHGAGDQITDPHASKYFSENISNCCTFKMWENAYHELHNEPCKNEVFSFILNWMEKILQDLNK